MKIRRVWCLVSVWKRPRYVLAFALVSALLTWGGWQAWHWFQTRSHLLAAQTALSHQDFDLALEHLEIALHDRPRDAELHLLAARTARRGTQFNRAEEHLSQLRRLRKEEDPERVLECALLQAQRGQLEDAETYLQERLRQEDPQSSFILEALGLGYLHVYRLGAALHHFDLLLEREPDNILALHGRASLREVMGRTKEALADYRLAVESQPENPQARLRLAEYLISQYQADAAVEHLDWLRQRLPRKPAVLLALTRCRSVLGDREEAKQLLETLLSIEPDNAGGLVEQGKLALEENQSALAESCLRRALERWPYDRQMLYFLVRALADQGKHAEAKTFAARLESIDVDPGRMEQLLRAINRDPDAAGPRYELGTLCLRVGQEYVGLRWLTGVLQLHPDHAPTHQALAEYYERQGDSQRAEFYRQRGQGAPSNKKANIDKKPDGNGTR